MKSINEMFENSPHLKSYPEVKELIEYCQDLEGEVIESQQAKQFSFEDKLTNLVRDINHSINQAVAEDEESIRFKETERVDYESAIKNLGEYIKKFASDNKFRL